MTSTAASRRQREAAAPRELLLVNWPLRDRAPVSWLAVAAAVAVAVTISSVASSPASGLAAFAALLLAMWRLWLPVRFEIGPQGVTESVLSRRRRIPWRKIGGFQTRRGGVALFPRPNELRAVAPRSLFIHGGRELDRLVEIVAFFLGEPAAVDRSRGSTGRGVRSRGSTAGSRRAAPASQETELRPQEPSATQERGDANQETQP